MRTLWIERAVGAGILSVSAWAQVTEQVSQASGGEPGLVSSADPSISADGRHVAFASNANDHVPGDTNNLFDVFVRDRQTNAVERISLSTAGAQGDGGSAAPSLSREGRFVAFTSEATNLVPDDANDLEDVFVRDRATGTTTRVSVDSAGGEADAMCISPSISEDGRYVAFESTATNLVAGDTNGVFDVFVHDRQSGTTVRVSVATDGTQGTGWNRLPTLSQDGRLVAFHSLSPNLVSGDTNGHYDVFVRDLVAGTTERVSLGAGGVEALGPSNFAAISREGRHVAFESFAANLAPGDANGVGDIFVRDRQLGITERVSIATDGSEANGRSSWPTISLDGRYVAFASPATNLVPGDTNGWDDVFVRDRLLGTTVRVSVTSGGAAADGPSTLPSIADSGREVAFVSSALNLAVVDYDYPHVYLSDRAYEPVTSMCEVGSPVVLDCPCANPPSGPGRGCDNSSGTGGAVLSAAGAAYLSMDSLVFETSGEKPTALSILLQGDGDLTAGQVYGQGVRCVAGSLKRLYVRAAAGGSITVPDAGAGDPTVSARSAERGDPIAGGESRWYLVYYRDAVVLGGCPPTSTFNATQTGHVGWSF